MPLERPVELTAVEVIPPTFHATGGCDGAGVGSAQRDGLYSVGKASWISWRIAASCRAIAELAVVVISPAFHTTGSV